MEEYKVTGMTCAACQARVEKAVGSLDGCESCSVSLLTNSMVVEGDLTTSEVIDAVRRAGYGASLLGADKSREEELFEDRETPVLKKRLFASVVFLLILMYFTMGHEMLRLPLPSVFDNMTASGIVQMFIAGIIAVINSRFFVSGSKALLHGSPNMDSLVAMGSGTAYLYSVCVLVLSCSGDDRYADLLSTGLYFEASAMILTLITVGKTLESYSKGRTTDAIKGLMKLSPKTAVVVVDGTEVTIPVDDMKVGDIFVLRPGDIIPADGKVVEGVSAVNEASVTGESIPVDKALGDIVISGSENGNGYLKVRAEKVGKDTTLSGIIHMVTEAAAGKAPIARLADRVSAYFVPAVIAIAVIVFIVWMLTGNTVGFSLARAISVLVVSCPCALGLATPVAIMAGSGKGARKGILFKTAAALQESGKTDIVVLDKTGTVTEGKPVLAGVYPEPGVEISYLEDVAYALEVGSEHPIAKAVTGALNSERSLEATGFKALPGYGVKAIIGDKSFYAGNLKLIESHLSLPFTLTERISESAGRGETPVIIASEECVLGFISVADKIRDDAAEGIAELRNLGIHTVMLTGDNARSAAFVADMVGVDEYMSDCLPSGKADVIAYLKEQGKVLMAGDGINDAPALTAADTGMAVKNGTDIAIDAADVVLMKEKISDIAAAVKLSRKTYKIIKENLFWALFYNCILIPVACGLLIPFGISMNPMFGAFAMSMSSIFVVTNALRLNLYDPYKKTGSKTVFSERRLLDGYKNVSLKGEKTMEKTMKIEGMMCMHCEASVKKALEALDGVSAAIPSHKDGEAKVILSADVSDDVLKKCVEDLDYKVTGIV